jgi:hypothetical protein
MQRLLHGGWQNYARPLVADYVDRLAAQIGSPPDVQRAQALTQALPITVRIEGPQVQFDSHPGRRTFRGTTPSANSARRLGPGAQHRRWPPPELRPGRGAGCVAPAHLWLDHAGRAAAADRRCLHHGAAHPQAAAAHRRRRGGFWRRRFFQAHPRRTPRRTRRAGRAHQRHGGQPERHAGCQAHPAAGHQPRTAQPADTRPRQRRAAGRRPRAPGPAARPGGDGRPDQQPARKRTPGRRPPRAARRADGSAGPGPRRRWTLSRRRWP